MLIKAFLLLCLLAGVIHSLTESNPGTDNEFEACWERCYQVSYYFFCHNFILKYYLKKNFRKQMKVPK